MAEATGYVYEGRLRGLDEPAKAGFAAKSRGLQPPGFNNLGRLAIPGLRQSHAYSFPESRDRLRWLTADRCQK